MADVHTIITTIKPLVYWLDRSPFAGDKDYIDCKTNLLQYGFEMATSANRGIFSEQPVCTIRKICKKLAIIADHIIQDVMDPMILQPTSLDLATLKKREQELGFFILPNNHAVHQIADIKHGSPAHSSSKIEEGDEIVQVNYQTVVGWQRKKVMMLLQESPPEIVLTLRKRPRHTKVYGQIYMKPYRLPSRKTNGQTWSSRWNDNIPSPRLLPILDLPPIKISKTDESKEIHDIETELSSSDSEPPDSPLDGSCRMYPLKPRPILQRRNTISGATPTNKRPYPSLDQYWDFIKSRSNTAHSSTCNINSVKFEQDSNFLRDKSASCNVGLDLTPRPTTVIGLGQNSSHKKSFKDKALKKKVNFEEEKENQKKQEKPPTALQPTNLSTEKSVSVNSLASLNNENITFIDEGRDLTDRTSMALNWQKEIVEEIIETIKMKPVETKPSSVIEKDPILSEINVHNIIKKFDEQKHDNLARPKVLPRSLVKKPPDVPQKPEGKVKPAVPPRSATTKLRGRLDKSHSTPAYDLSEDLPEKPETLLKSVAERKLESPNDSRSAQKDALNESDSKTSSESKENASSERSSDTSGNISESSRNNETADKPNLENIEHQMSGDSGVNTFDTSIEKSQEYQSETQFETIASAEDINTIGIPVVSSSFERHEYHEIISSKVETNEPEVKISDVPPKPPPRNIVDISKPAYPADSPKPSLPEVLKGGKNEPSKPVFEFPDTSPVENSLPTSIQVEIHPKPHHDDKPPLTPRSFDPKSISTPVTKTKMGFEADTIYKASPNYEVQKISTESKVSPTNSIVKAMISGKGKSLKKKNNVMAKRRRVSVTELSPADIQGYLYQRLRGKHNQNVHWEKRWFVLLGSCLYGFKTKEDTKAACLIFLSEFTVAVASEVKSRMNAFKVYHTGTVFYFSADDADTLQQWIDLIKVVTLHHEPLKQLPSTLYSETEDELDDEGKISDKKRPPDKSDSLKKFGSLKKFSSKKNNDASHTGSTSLDRKWFFNKSSEKPKNSLPIPTAQFRSYRKIRSSESSSVTTGNFTSHVPFFTPHNLSNAPNSSIPNLTMEVTTQDQVHSSKLMKPKPINYIHASNPSLCSTGDYDAGLPPRAFNKKPFKPCQENLAGLMTLEELMIKQTEERKMNPHHIVEEVTKGLQMVKPDVVYGEVPIRSKVSEESLEVQSTCSKSKSSSEKHGSSSSCFGKRLGSLKKNSNKTEEFEHKNSTYPKTTKGYDQKVNRSLPRTHKMLDSYTTYETEQSISKYKERSYEMIYCPETTNDVQYAMNRTLDDTMYHDAPKKGLSLKKQHSFTLADKKSKKVHDSSTSKVKLKSAIQYTPVSLPLSQDPKSKPKFAFELNLDEKSQKGGKLKNMFGSGKSEAKKEKTFLGSPKLHRAIFRKHNSGPDTTWPTTASTTQVVPMSESTYDIETPAPPIVPETFPMNISPHVDYPGLEYPPVFEPETYSLANPQTSLSILRKQNKNL
ncbi:unnamed protein product [Acanthoscelides obtectus]|nr:unnamed protein product [Acanthoscelides obtectus]CAK1630663.1 Connector enhancer of kinase suppressor of ras 2 [Acanthoscelides obtectus]